jgi:hypothetical protein
MTPVVSQDVNSQQTHQFAGHDTVLYQYRSLVTRRKLMVSNILTFTNDEVLLHLADEPSPPPRGKDGKKARWAQVIQYIKKQELWDTNVFEEYKNLPRTKQGDICLLSSGMSHTDTHKLSHNV